MGRKADAPAKGGSALHLEQASGAAAGGGGGGGAGAATGYTRPDVRSRAIGFRCAQYASPSAPLGYAAADAISQPQERSRKGDSRNEKLHVCAFAFAQAKHQRV